MARVSAFFISLIALLYISINVSGHAYFINPAPRMPYCYQNSTCTAPNNPKGPVWKWPTNSNFTAAGTNPPQTGCSTSGGTFAGSSSDPAFVMNEATWTVGYYHKVTVFISEAHPNLYNPAIPSDGWQLRWRDGSMASNVFQPMYIYWNNQHGFGPFSSDSFQTGSNQTIGFYAPSTTYSDLELQFIWSLSGLQPGGAGAGSAMWLSCTDVQVIPDNWVGSWAPANATLCDQTRCCCFTSFTSQDFFGLQLEFFGPVAGACGGITVEDSYVIYLSGGTVNGLNPRVGPDSPLFTLSEDSNSIVSTEVSSYCNTVYLRTSNAYAAVSVNLVLMLVLGLLMGAVSLI